MVELAVGPQHRVMAILASRWEAQTQMINRRLCRVVVGLVTAHASCVR